MEEVRFFWIAAFFINSLVAYPARSKGDKPQQGFISIRDARILQLAMLMTVAADYNLILRGSTEPGLMAFCAVQGLYCYRYGGGKTVFLLLSCWCALAIALVNFVPYDPVVFLAAFYAAAFGLSLVSAAKWAKKNPYPNNRLVLWGMVLFALCDINVALSFLEIRPDITFNLIWIFYLPAQLMLSSSSKRFATPQWYPQQ